MSEIYPYPRVGVGVWVCKDGKVLLGRRKSSHSPDTWCPPGGKLEMYESWEDCASRETLEESGVSIKNRRFITATNDIYENRNHYVTIYIVAEWGNGEPQILEPDKMIDWQWFAWNELPKPLLKSTQNFIDLGINPLEF